MDKFFIFISIFAVFASSAHAELLIVTKNNSPIREIQIEDLKNLYLGKKIEIVLGHPLKLYMPEADTEEMKEFLQKVIGKSGKEFQAYWRIIIFRGRGTPPNEVKSFSEMLQALNSDKHTLGFISSKNPPQDLKVLLKIN